jgi:hypothetical protein
MHLRLAFFFIAPLIAGSTPYTAVKNDFGNSAMAPVGAFPSEYAEFNATDPSVNALLAGQICGTRHQPSEVGVIGAQPRQIVAAGGTCARHTPIFGP